MNTKKNKNTKQSKTTTLGVKGKTTRRKNTNEKSGDKNVMRTNNGNLNNPGNGIIPKNLHEKLNRVYINAVRNEGTPVELRRAYHALLKLSPDSRAKACIEMIKDKDQSLGVAGKLLNLLRFSDISRDEWISIYEYVEAHPEYNTDLASFGTHYNMVTGKSISAEDYKQAKTIDIANSFPYIKTLTSVKFEIVKATEFMNRITIARDNSNRFKIRPNGRATMDEDEVKLSMAKLAELNPDLPYMILHTAFQQEPWFVSLQQSLIRNYDDVVRAHVPAKWILRKIYLDHYIAWLKYYIVEKDGGKLSLNMFNSKLEIIDVDETNLTIYAYYSSKTVNKENTDADLNYVLATAPSIISTNENSIQKVDNLMKALQLSDNDFNNIHEACEELCINKQKLAIKDKYMDTDGTVLKTNRRRKAPKFNLFDQN